MYAIEELAPERAECGGRGCIPIEPALLIRSARDGGGIATNVSIRMWDKQPIKEIARLLAL